MPTTNLSYTHLDLCSKNWRSSQEVVQPYKTFASVLCGKKLYEYLSGELGFCFDLAIKHHFISDVHVTAIR